VGEKKGEDPESAGMGGNMAAPEMSGPARTVKRLAQTATGFGFGMLILFAARLLPDVQQALGTAAAGSLIAAACLMVGAVLGFLFGLPRILHQEPAPGELGTVAHRVNTNLEQISDWLTKILVGLGLANIGRIPDQLTTLSRRLAVALSAQPSAASEQLALAVVTFFLVLGFLLGYLWTRLELAPAIRQADLSSVGTEDRSRQKVDNLVEKADAALSTDSPVAIKEGLGWAEQALAKASDDDPNRIPALIAKGRALHRLGKTREALQVVEEVLAREPDHFSARYNKACYRLRVGHPIQEVLETLALAFKLAPFLKDYALWDPDLEPIREDPAFRALVDNDSPGG
jgi:tetratricopeptide (TPR) repeat protein